MATFTDAPQLPGWLQREFPFHRKIAQLPAGKIHYVDEGEGRPVLLLHGNPTWSYLWRNVIRQLPVGLRAVAPDLLGLGLSEKPRRPDEHTLARHVDAIAQLVEALELRNAILVGQDWGGPIGAGVAARMPERFTGAVFANTTVIEPRRPLKTTRFHRLSQVPLLSDVLFRAVGFPLQTLWMVQGKRRMAIEPSLAYAWPLWRPKDRAAPLGLARMVPDREDHPSLPLIEEGAKWARGFKGPVELVWGVRDPILGRALKRHREVWPEARVTETQAGHFLQEEVPEELAAAIARVATAKA